MVSNLFLTFLAATADGSNVNEAALSRGEAVVFRQKEEGQDSYASVGQIRIDVPPDRVWALVADCTKYSLFMERVELAELVSSSTDTAFQSGSARCKVKLGLPWPLGSLTSVTDVQFTVEPGVKWSRTWHLVSGDYYWVHGLWDLRPLDQGQATFVTYRMRAKPKLALPEGLLELAQNHGLPKMLKALRREAMKIKNSN